MELTLIDFYRAIEDSSAKMLQAAQNKDWAVSYTHLTLPTTPYV